MFGLGPAIQTTRVDLVNNSHGDRPSHERVLRMILRQGMTPAWSGLAVGVALSAVTSRVVPSLVPVNHRYDFRTFFVVVPLLLLVTLVAAYVAA